jgi:hypothetical protein
MKALVPLVITEPISREILERGVRRAVHEMPEEDRKPALRFYSNYMGHSDQRVVEYFTVKYLLKSPFRR